MLDACCVINLYATGHISSILMAVERSVAIAVYVKDVEARHIKGRTVDDADTVLEAIDLLPLIKADLLHTVDTDSDEEKESYLAFAAAIGDDGEAISGAIALHRGWAMACDDVKARRYLKRVAPAVQLVSTPEILRFWAEKTSVDQNALRSVLSDIYIRASYEPRRRDPMYGWWCACRS